MAKNELLWFEGGFLRFCQAMYEGFESAVEINRKCTPYFPVNCGVKQGCLLSPSLFNLYINDLIDLVSSELGIQCGKYANIPILAYAEDIVLLAPSADSLQTLLNVLQSWCTSNGIKVNSDSNAFQKAALP